MQKVIFNHVFEIKEINDLNLLKIKSLNDLIKVWFQDNK